MSPFSITTTTAVPTSSSPTARRFRASRKTSPEFSNRLFRNNCDLTFTDVTAEAGLAGEGYSMAAAVGDFDNDGFTDLFVAGVKGNASIAILGMAVSPM